MSNSENTEALIPIVEVESSPLASTSVDRVSSDESDTSSEESVGTSAEIFPQTNDGILVVPRVRASNNTSFDWLTIRVAIPLDTKFPKTSYGGVIATGLTTRELPNSNILHREADDFDSSEELPKTNKTAPWALLPKNNMVGHELPTLALEVDRTRFMMLYMTECRAMSNYFIPIPVDNF